MPSRAFIELVFYTCLGRYDLIDLMADKVDFLEKE
jgi:hypothetical protein